MMKPLRTIGSAGALTAALAVAACAVREAPPPAQPVLVPVQIQPQHTGTGQRFVACTSECERPTPKTIGRATVSASVPVQRPVNARVSSPATPAVVPAVVTAAAPARSAPAEPVAEKPQTERFSVTFPLGSTKLTPAASDLLRQLAPHLSTATTVRITGFTDNLGPATPNARIAEARALAVLVRLRELLPEAPFKGSALGQALCCYVAPNESDEGRESNRRAEVEVLLEQPAGLRKALARVPKAVRVADARPVAATTPTTKEAQ